LLRRLAVAQTAARRMRVGVVTTTAGGAARVVDQLAIRKVAVEGPTKETLARLAAAGVQVAPERIVDLTLAGTRYEIVKRALDVLLTAPEFDLIVAVPGSSARFEPGLTVRPLIESASAEKPLAAFIVPDAPQALKQLTQAGVPNFRTPEACGDAIAAAFARRKPRAFSDFAPRIGGNGRLLDELSAYFLLAGRGIAHAPAVALHVKTGTDTPLPFPYPVAVKLLSEHIAHKSDVGGVVLNVPNENALTEAVANIRANVEKASPGANVDHVLIQQMAKGVGEVLIGYRNDPQVGPIIMLASGGVLTEIYRDRSLRLAPVDLETAHQMIAEVKAIETLSGYRGKPAGDLDALAAAIVALSGLATKNNPAIIEAEINPLLVLEKGKGVLAVDALVRLAAP
jgi:acyl-CoA synthetase (NDP forming)